ncbi:unnamed protein product, partial [Prunus brigantina]
LKGGSKCSFTILSKIQHPYYDETLLAAVAAGGIQDHHVSWGKQLVVQQHMDHLDCIRELGVVALDRVEEADTLDMCRQAVEVLQGRILTSEQRARRQLTNDPSCNFCDWFFEYGVHLLRDCPRAKAIVGGFSVNLGIGQILEAELWRLFFGLQLAMARGISNLVIEMDSVLVVHLMKNPDTIGGICWFDSVPLWAGVALVDDLIGVSRPRLIRVV